MRPVRPALRRTAATVGLGAAALGLAVCGATTASASTTSAWTAATPIAVGSGPAHLALDPNTHRAFVTNNDGDGTQLNVIDTTTNTLLSSISTGQAFPAAIAVNPSSHQIYASANYGSTISVTDEDGAAGTAITVTGASQLGSMAVDPTTDTLYVTGVDNNGGGGFGGTPRIWAVDLSDGSSTPVATINSFYMSAPTVTYDMVSHVAYAGTGSNTVINLTTGASSSTPSIGGAVAVDPSRHALWAANAQGGTASLVDTQTGKFIVTVPLGGSPSTVAIDPSAGLVYISNSSYNSVSVIDEDSHAVLATVPVDVNPQALAVDPNTDDVYVVNSGTPGSVSVIHQGTQSVKPQVIHFTSTVPAHAYVQGTYTATATGGDSGNRVLFSTDPHSYGVCNVSLRGVVVFAKTGTCIIDADQDGAGLFTDAPTATQTIHVVQRAQTITFPALKTLHVKQAQALHATSSAKLPVTYTVGTPKTCSVSHGAVVAKAAGSCVVNANAAANAVYAKAAAKSAKFTIKR